MLPRCSDNFISKERDRVPQGLIISPLLPLRPGLGLNFSSEKEENVFRRLNRHHFKAWLSSIRRHQDVPVTGYQTDSPSNHQPTPRYASNHYSESNSELDDTENQFSMMSWSDDSAQKNDSFLDEKELALSVLKNHNDCSYTDDCFIRAARRIEEADRLMVEARRQWNAYFSSIDNSHCLAPVRQPLPVAVDENEVPSYPPEPPKRTRFLGKTSKGDPAMTLCTSEPEWHIHEVDLPSTNMSPQLASLRGSPLQEIVDLNGQTIPELVSVPSKKARTHSLI